MKRFFSFLLALALLSGLCFSAFADGESTGGKQAVKAIITGAPSWELVIPADQTIQYLTEETDIVHGDCSINNAKHIPANSTINATLTHTGTFTMDNDNSKTLAFKLTAHEKEWAVGDKVIVSQYWSDTNAYGNYYEINIVISKETWQNAEGGGNYTTHVTYTSVLAEGEITDTPNGTDRPDKAP